MRSEESTRGRGQDISPEGTEIQRLQLQKRVQTNNRGNHAQGTGERMRTCMRKHGNGVITSVITIDTEIITRSI